MDHDIRCGELTWILVDTWAFLSRGAECADFLPLRAGSPRGRRRGCGVGCTGLSWTSSEPGASSTGPPRSSTPPQYGRKRGALTGPNPVDRGEKGSKLHVSSEAQGIPLAVTVSGAHTHGSPALKPLIRGIPAIRSRRGPCRRRPVKFRADKACFSADHLAWPRERGIVPRIARPGIESSERLGRHCWKIERSIAWLFGYRRLTVRYERKGSYFLAFAAALTCYKKLAKLTT
ncbi:transposase [Streptomyces cinereoruber]|uniref:transposase n=1 Tax=Streptomyces cinereoruber TaxID=67260 RepID=UPI003C2F4FAF